MLNGLAHLNGRNGLLNGGNIGAGGDRFQTNLGGAVDVIGENVHALLGGGIAQRQANQEPVQLGLRQGEGAGGLHRVLGGDDEEGGAQGLGFSVHGDLLFLHALQQSGLRPGGGSVDLVGQKNVGEGRSRLEIKISGFLVIDAQTSDVRGQQVCGELDAFKVAVNGLGQIFGQDRFSGSGHIVQ